VNGYPFEPFPIIRRSPRWADSSTLAKPPAKRRRTQSPSKSCATTRSRSRVQLSVWV